MKDNALEVARAALRAVELLDSDHYMAAIRIARRALRKIGRRPRRSK